MEYNPHSLTQIVTGFRVICVTVYANCGNIPVESDSKTPEKLIRISTAAKQSGMGVSSLYSAIERGKLKCTDVDGWKMVYLSDVLAFKAMPKHGNPKPGPRAKPSPIPEDT
jgi:hypothetical protein